MFIPAKVEITAKKVTISATSVTWVDIPASIFRNS
jgi:hypothetical protein